jgi:hypothetical protein
MVSGRASDRRGKHTEHKDGKDGDGKLQGNLDGIDVLSDESSCFKMNWRWQAMVEGVIETLYGVGDAKILHKLLYAIVEQSRQLNVGGQAQELAAVGKSQALFLCACAL